MARIRTIKPEFWTSEQIVECSPIARLLFVGMWNFCDDAGIHPDSAKRLKMEVFPADSFSLEEVESMISELINQGLVRRYQSGGTGYLIVTGWHHQKIERPNCRYPKPDGGSKFGDQSSNGLRAIDDQSATDRPRICKGMEGKGMEGKGEESTIARRSLSLDVEIPDELRTDAFSSIWGEWVSYRFEIKKLLTKSQATNQLAMLAGLGVDRAVAMVRHTMTQGWVGLREAEQRPGAVDGDAAIRKTRKLLDNIAAAKAESVAKGGLAEEVEAMVKGKSDG